MCNRGTIINYSSSEHFFNRYTPDTLAIAFMLLKPVFEK
jgi:hypothetical protein